MIKNRLKFLKAVHEKREDQNKPSTVKLEMRPPKLPGQPWLKLNSFDEQYMETYAKELHRLHYKFPADGTLEDIPSVNLLLDDLILSDEESGANRQLGFLFLYDLIRDKIKLNIMGKNWAKTLGELFTRHLQLKLARWGEEGTEEGELEYRPSWSMTRLGSLLACPRNSWPDIPNDETTVEALQNGINVTSRDIQRTSLPDFLRGIQTELKTIMDSDEYNVRKNSFIISLSLSRDHTLSLSRLVSILPEEERWNSKKRLESSDTSCESRTFLPKILF